MCNSKHQRSVIQTNHNQIRYTHRAGIATLFDKFKKCVYAGFDALVKSIDIGNILYVTKYLVRWQKCSNSSKKSTMRLKHRHRKSSSTSGNSSCSWRQCGCLKVAYLEFIFTKNIFETEYVAAE